jgi:hypothetical protein
MEMWKELEAILGGRHTIKLYKHAAPCSPYLDRPHRGSATCTAQKVGPALRREEARY